MRWITWVEPFAPSNEAVYCTISEKTAVEVQRSIHEYETDEQALEDFMIVHWARFCNSPKSLIPGVENKGGNMKIESFSGPYRFLSNFFRATNGVIFDGQEYPTVEHAYQAAKCAIPTDRLRFITGTPTEAKRLGRIVLLREDWESVKESFMLDFLRQKFLGTDLTANLLATGDAELIEGNYWRDKYWGVCNGEGKNRLGILLMQVREEARPHDPNCP